MINDASRKALDRGLDRYGLLEPIVANRTTGHVLGGHRRLEWLDKKERGQDYALDVSWVEVPEAEEPAVLILLNNERAQGEWDFGVLRDLLASAEQWTAEDAGFDSLQLEAMFPDDFTVSGIFADAPNEAAEDALKLVKIKEERAGFNEKRKGVGSDPALDTETYFVVVFATRKEKENFLRGKGIDARERYIAHNRLFPDDTK